MDFTSWDQQYSCFLAGYLTTVLLVGLVRSLIIALELKERTQCMKVGGEVKATVSGISHSDNQIRGYTIVHYNFHTYFLLLPVVILFLDD
jgi:hypothetical protein